VLGGRQTALGGAALKIDRPGQVFLNAAALQIHDGKIVLRARVAGCRKIDEFAQRGLVISLLLSFDPGMNIGAAGRGGQNQHQNGEGENSWSGPDEVKPQMRLRKF
jgi:hypothetical protein